MYNTAPASSAGLPLLEEEEEDDEEKLVKMLEVRELQKQYSKKELDELLEAPCTIHYYPPPKPPRHRPPRPAYPPPEAYYPGDRPPPRAVRQHRRPRHHPGYYHPPPQLPHPGVDYEDDSVWSAEDPAYAPAHLPHPAAHESAARVRQVPKSARYQSSGAGPMRYYYDRDPSPDVIEIPDPAVEHNEPPYEDYGAVPSPAQSVSPPYAPAIPQKSPSSYSIQSQTVLHRRNGSRNRGSYQYQVLFEERGTIPKTPSVESAESSVHPVQAVPIPTSDIPQVPTKKISKNSSSSKESLRVSGTPPIVAAVRDSDSSETAGASTSSSKKRSHSELEASKPAERSVKKKGNHKSNTDYLTPYQYFKLIERGKRMFLFEDKDTDKDVDVLQQKWKDLSNFEKSPYFTLASMPFRKHIKGQLKDRTFDDQPPSLIVPQDPVGNGSRQARNLTKTKLISLDPIVAPIMEEVSREVEGVKKEAATQGQADSEKFIKTKPEDRKPVVASAPAQDDTSDEFAPHYLNILKRMQN